MNEQEVLAPYESGVLKSVASKPDVAKFEAAAYASATTDKRIDVGLSAGGLRGGASNSGAFLERLGA